MSGQIKTVDDCIPVPADPDLQKDPDIPDRFLYQVFPNDVLPQKKQKKRRHLRRKFLVLAFVPDVLQNLGLKLFVLHVFPDAPADLKCDTVRRYQI